MPAQAEVIIDTFVYAFLTESPVLLTVPHDGMAARNFKSFLPHRNNDITLHDWATWSIVSDMLDACDANVVRGMLPRTIVDYNRSPAEAFEHTQASDSYSAYHALIGRALSSMRQTHPEDRILLLDVHGFVKQPVYAPEGGYDIILGTGNRSTIAHGEPDRELSDFLIKLGYQVFLPSASPVRPEGDVLNGRYTVRHWSRKLRVNCIQLEIARQFRERDAKELGQKLAIDLATFIRLRNHS